MAGTWLDVTGGGDKLVSESASGASRDDPQGNGLADRIIEWPQGGGQASAQSELADLEAQIAGNAELSRLVELFAREKVRNLLGGTDYPRQPAKERLAPELTTDVTLDDAPLPLHPDGLLPTPPPGEYQVREAATGRSSSGVRTRRYAR